MKSNLEFIDVIDTKGRKSSLAINGKPHYSASGFLKVIGNLEHGADIKPADSANARRLADFITAGQYSKLIEALRECITEPGALAGRNFKYARMRLEYISQQAARAIEAEKREA